MSLALLQGYSSAEEEDDEQNAVTKHRFSEDTSDEDDETVTNRSVTDDYFPKPSVSSSSSSSSSLPSAFHVFSEISGPPEFLNNAVSEAPPPPAADRKVWHGRRQDPRDSKDLPAGAVVEAKAQLVGIRDRVRSDLEGSFPTTTGVTQKGSSAGTGGDGKRVITAANPGATDAAELLRMCLQCGVPKTFSNARGMVCPICSDRPLSDPSSIEKKKGSTVKEKEKSKRMKGQSSHSTWKSETEMQLRQQFD